MEPNAACQGVILVRQVVDVAIFHHRLCDIAEIHLAEGIDSVKDIPKQEGVGKLRGTKEIVAVVDVRKFRKLDHSLNFFPPLGFLENMPLTFFVSASMAANIASICSPVYS